MNLQTAWYNLTTSKHQKALDAEDRRIERSLAKAKLFTINSLDNVDADAFHNKLDIGDIVGLAIGDNEEEMLHARLTYRENTDTYWLHDFAFDAKAKVAAHRHIPIEIAKVDSGKLRMIFPTRSVELTAGQSDKAERNQLHAYEAITDCTGTFKLLK